MAICKTNGISIHYTRTGGNKPPLIMLHGLMTSGACFIPIALALAEEYDVILPDARGHGKSSAPNFGYRYEDHANDVIGLIDSLKLSAPILIGHSMGGMTATVVASLRLSIIRGLILADPSFLSAEVQQSVCDSEVADQHRRILSKSFDELVSDARVRQPHRSLELIKLIAEARLQTSMSAFDVLKPPARDFMSLVSKIDIPSLLVFGDTGNIVSSTLASDIQRQNNKFRFTLIKDAGHGLPFDQPQRFVSAIKDFLSSPFFGDMDIFPRVPCIQ
jgi:N-formylmaleamate deformylase